MTTPERKIKDKVREVLRDQEVYYFMPVQMGYGPSGLDFHCVVLTKTGYPFPFFIETKAPGKEPTVRQQDLAKRLRETFKCKVWVVDKEIDVRSLEAWLCQIRGV